MVTLDQDKGKGSSTAPKGSTPAQPYGVGLGPGNHKQGCSPAPRGPGIWSQFCACLSVSLVPSPVLYVSCFLVGDVSLHSLP